METAGFLYGATGEKQTVTFAVDKVNLDSTITIIDPVRVSGNGNVTIKANNPFTGDSVFIVDAGSPNAVIFSGVTIEGKSEVRGIEVASGDLVLNGVTIMNGLTDADHFITPESVPTKKGGAIYVDRKSVV